MLMVVSVVAIVVTSLTLLLMSQFDSSTERLRQLSSDSLSNSMVELLDRYATQLGIGVVRDAAVPLANLDTQRLDQILREVRAQPGVDNAVFFDVNFDVVAYVNATTIGGNGPSADAGVAGSAEQATWSATVRELDFPITQSGSVVGWLRLSLSLKPIYAQIEAVDAKLDELIEQGKARNWAHVVTTAGLFLVFAIGIAVFVGRTLVTPIRQLASYAAGVGVGNYDSPLPLARVDELGDLARSLKTMSDNLQITTGEVHYLAYHDSLTRLPNRTQLKQSLRQAIARGERGAHSVALLFIDLDDFKRVNDTLGHEAGDTLLKEFALRLRQCLRSGDDTEANTDLEPRETIARLGGDEFTVVLNSVREGPDAGVVANRILAVLEEPFLLSGQEVVIGASIGITTFPEDGADVDTLLRNADVAMYQAKERGKNQFEFYNDSMHRMATERLSLETDLRHAVEYEQMRILYQPIMDVRTRSLVGIEAQLRWIHPALGGILPSVFVPLAEQSGYIVELDQWVIERTCADLAELRDQGFDDFTMSATLSSVHFRNQAIAPTLIEALNRNHLEAHRIALAISEKTLMRNIPRASALLNELRERGVHAWIDGFGSGHSPLGYLPRTPVMGLKIDSDYVSAIARGDNERAIVSTVIAMAHSLNLKVTATGVENPDQVELLRDVGCDFVQGSLFVRPMQLPELVLYLERQARDRQRTGQTGTFGAIPLGKPARAS